MVVSGLVKLGAVGVIALIAFYLFTNRVTRDEVTGETPAEKGALRNTADFLLGDGSTAKLDSGSQVDLRTGETRNEKGALRNTFDFFFGDGTSAIAATGIRTSLTSKNPPKPAATIPSIPRNNFGGRRRRG